MVMYDGKEPESNDPGAFYTHARKDFEARIVHVLQYRSRHTHQPIGHWKEAVFSVEAENEAFGGAKTISASNDDWMCAMASDNSSQPFR